MATLSLEFWGTVKLSSKVAAPFYSSTGTVWGFQIPYIFANTCWLSTFFILAILVSVKWYLIEVWNCISLTANNVEYLFTCLLLFFISLCWFESFISAWKTPFIIVFRASLLAMNSLGFYLYGKVLISPSFWRIILLDMEMLVDNLFPSALWICHPTAFWSPWFLMRSQLLTLWEFPCMLFVIFPLLLSIIFVCL